MRISSTIERGWDLMGCHPHVAGTLTDDLRLYIGDHARDGRE